MRRCSHPRSMRFILVSLRVPQPRGAPCMHPPQIGDVIYHPPKGAWKNHPKLELRRESSIWQDAAAGRVVTATDGQTRPSVRPSRPIRLVSVT
jgi:hypothetical protein